MVTAVLFGQSRRTWKGFYNWDIRRTMMMMIMMMKTMWNLTGSMLSSIGNCPSLSLLSTWSLSSVIVLNDNHLDWNHHWPSLDIIVINLTGIIKVHLNLETELEAVRNRLRTKSTGFEHLTFPSFLLLYMYAHMYTWNFKRMSPNHSGETYFRVTLVSEKLR